MYGPDKTNYYRMAKIYECIGNIAAAQSAKAIGKYNEKLAYQQAHTKEKKLQSNKKFITILKDLDLLKNKKELILIFL